MPIADAVMIAMRMSASVWTTERADEKLPGNVKPWEARASRSGRVEAGLLFRGIAGGQVMARDRARDASLVLLQRRRHRQVAAGALEILVREEPAPHRELAEEDREDEQDPEHPALAQLEPLPAPQIGDVPD